jgi:hypothetical protein
VTAIIPAFVQVVPPIELVSAHAYVPAAVYACEAFCAIELCPSPNVHEYDAVPEHPVAVAWNSAADPTVALEGTLAVQVTLQGAAVVA